MRAASPHPSLVGMEDFICLPCNLWQKYAEITELKDDSIKFIIPDTHLKSPYEISLIARETLTFTEPFTPIYPIINSFDKSEVFTGEKLIITGENFLINGDSAQFYIGSKIPVIELSEQRAVVRITGKDYFVLGREEVELTLNVRSGAKSSYYFDQKLKIKFPWKILPIIPTNSIYKKQSFSYDNKGYIYEPNSLELLEYNPTDFKWRTITNYPGNFDEGSLCLQMNGIFYKLCWIQWFMELDEKDIQLLEILEQNAKSPVQELSDKTGIPASTVHHRIKKLETNNIIKRYTAQLNEKVMGRGFSAYVMVNGSPEKYLDNDFFNHKYVSEVSAVTGNYDLIIKIQCANLDQFNDFLQEFREKYGKFLTQTVTMVCTETLV